MADAEEPVLEPAAGAEAEPELAPAEAAAEEEQGAVAEPAEGALDDPAEGDGVNNNNNNKRKYDEAAEGDAPDEEHMPNKRPSFNGPSNGAAEVRSAAYAFIRGGQVSVQVRCAG